MQHRVTRPRFAKKPLAIALLGAALGLQASLLQPLTAAGQASAAEQQRSFSIAAGPLGAVLSRFASDAGVVLSFDARLTDGKHSSGLNGRYSTEQGFTQLLQGHGLQVTRSENGDYILLPRAANGALELGATSVNATGLGATTEGTGSYTTGSTSTATKMNLSLRETPQSVSVFTRQRMDDQHLASVTDVLTQTPGITLSQDGGERFNLYSRGSAINTYQFDGVTTAQENQTRNMPSTLLDMALYDRVEIVRGATGLMTGAGEPSGVVNLIRKRPTREFKSYVQASIGSWDYYRSEADVSGPLTEDGNVRGRLVAAKQDNHTFMDWYDQKRELVYGVVEADLSDTTLVRFGVDYQKYRSNGAPGVPLSFTNGQPTDFSRSTSSGARWMYDDYETLNYTATLEQQLGDDWKLRVVTNYMDVDRDADLGWYRSTTGVSYLNQATGAASAERARIYADQIQRGADINLDGTWELFGRAHELVVGFNYSDYENNHRSQSGGVASFNFYTWDNYLAKGSYTPSQIFDISTRQTGWFAANRFNFTDDLHLILGARVSDYSYDYSLTSLIARTTTAYRMKERGVVTPYAGLIYDLTAEQSVYASYTDIFKPQSSQDRDGKPLDPVVGKNYEMGWKGEFYDGRLNASAAVYLVKRDNVAELDPGAKVLDTDNDAFRAVDGAETKGFDLEIAGEVAPGWNLHSGFSHSRTENAAGKRMNTQLPLDTFRLWSTYRLPDDWEKLTVGGGLNWNSSKSLTFGSNKIEDEDYVVASLMARYQVNQHLAATLNVNNLFDETYYTGMAGSYGH